MSPILFHIYGPFAVHAYGLFIALGFACALILIKRNPRARNLVSDDQAIALLCGSIISGVVGGRLLHYIVDPSGVTSWYDLLAFWQGGSAELGSVLGITIFVAAYTCYHHLGFLNFFDVMTLYAPLIQAFGRIGCFFAGCCYGAPTTVFWAVTYTDPLSLAPLCIPLHPTQLYSAALYFALFIILMVAQRFLIGKGHITASYFLGTAIIRFCIDFLRDDRTYSNSSWAFLGLFSTYQWIALCIAIASLLYLVVTLMRQKS